MMTRRPKTERLCDELERRVNACRSQGKPVPHALLVQLCLARTAALAGKRKEA